MRRTGRIVDQGLRYPRFHVYASPGEMIKTMLVGAVKLYRLLLSPWLGASCRFEPSCSVYALQALEMHGAAAGSYLALTRLVRCNPWCDGGCDAVPANKPSLFTKLLVTPSQKNPS